MFAVASAGHSFLMSQYPSLLVGTAFAVSLFSFAANTALARDVVNLDEGWRFALGHASDRTADYNFATGAFSYMAKTGYGDGAAGVLFDDRAWRVVEIPHDWGVEMPFDRNGTRNHGHRAFGPGFPETSVGWYRHTLAVFEADLGKRIYIECDGAFRDSLVFVNGFFVGREPSGYTDFSYDITDYLNYGGENVIAIRVDASLEEGWYYEGAGLYRDVRLVKTAPTHIAQHGVWARTLSLSDASAEMEFSCELKNTAPTGVSVAIEQTILSPSGKTVLTRTLPDVMIPAGASVSGSFNASIPNPEVWSHMTPALYTVKTRVLGEDKELDSRSDTFGIRTTVFDPNRGFLLNGEVVKLKGVNVHQDHAGVGVAMPPELLEWRLRELMKYGVNAIRMAHNPASPDLLELCDSLGLFLIDENRLMGSNEYHFDHLERMMRAGRSHPSVILWSIGNEEWAIEGNVKGARIGKTMQDFAHRIDPDRPCTAAISGGWGGTSSVTDVLGVNYIRQGRPDQQHKEYPWQPQVGTEETTTRQTRGYYGAHDESTCRMPPLRVEGLDPTEFGWKFYAERPHTAGVFYWTGFDYKGEPNPFAWPAVASQCGILDACGFPKDAAMYLRSWWTDQGGLAISPNWNLPGEAGKTVNVRVYGNYDEIELIVNGESKGRKTMSVNGHLEWDVVYIPGTISAVGYRDGREIARASNVTSGPAAKVLADVERIAARRGGHDLAVVNLRIEDAAGNVNPLADNLLRFSLSGPAKIIGVGNGDPACLEPDVFIPTIRTMTLGHWVSPDPANPGPEISFEASFDAPEVVQGAKIHLLLNTLGKIQTATLNGHELYRDAAPDVAKAEIALDSANLKATGNVLRLTAVPIDDRWARQRIWEEIVPATLRVEIPAAPWTRSAFNGYAQVLVQNTEGEGPIVLRVESDGLDDLELEL